MLLLASLLVAPRAMAGDLRSTLAGEGLLTSLADTAAKSVGRSLIVTAASAPVSYVFDVETGAYVREQRISGQLYLERPDTIGRGRWNFGVGYQYYAFDTFDGEDLGDLRDPLPIVGVDRRSLLAFEHVDIDIVAHQTTLNLTYGPTEAAELNVMVPILYTSIRRRDRVRSLIDDPPKTFEGEAAAHATGVGDVVLRGKLTLATYEMIQLAAGLGLRFPSGDTSDFQGTGSFDVQPSLYASRPIWDLPGRVRLQATLNAGMLLDTDDVTDSEGRWAVGIATSIGTRLALETAVLARHAVDRLVREGAFDLPRCLDGPGQCSGAQPATRVGERPLFGFDGARPDYFDLALGARVSAWRDSLFAFAGVLIPLNDPGLRAGPAPAVGLEGTF